MLWRIGILFNETNVPTFTNSTLHAYCGQTDPLCNLHSLNIKNDIVTINAKTTKTFNNTINISPNQNKWLVENQESNDLNDNLNCPVQYWQRMNKLAATIVVHIQGGW